MLIKTALQEYLNVQSTKPSIKGAYQSFINKHIAPYFSHAECSELSAGNIGTEDLKRFYMVRLADRLSGF